MKIKEMLSKISDDVLTEESKTAITEAFETAVSERVDERVKLELNEALTKLDEDHSQKLTGLLEKIDEDHTDKLKLVVGKINEDHTDKLKQIVKRYESMLQEEATGFKESLTTELSNYIDLYLDRMIPAKTINEACENTQARKIVEEMKKLVSVDESFINENVREALEDGKNTINALRTEVAEAIKENVKLNQSMKNVKAELVLEQKTATLPTQKKNFVMRVLKEKSPEYIIENFEYVVDMFEKDEVDAVDLLAESAKKEYTKTAIDTPESVLVENVNSSENNEQETPVSGYLSELAALDR